MKQLSLFTLVFCLAILTFLSNFILITPVAQGTYVSKYLAIIVLGSDEFVNASEKCYDTMSMWGCCKTLYLSSNLTLTPRANVTANKINFQWALTNWLNNISTPDTQVWIWIFSHGVGLHHQPPPSSRIEGWWSIDGGRAEVNSDEGPEITEYLINEDVNGDGDKSNTTWVGVDEGICLSPLTGNEIVWDDEFKEWLIGLNYRRMVIFIDSCRNPQVSENETASCYSGGFIDDLSAPRRIIITPTNETYYAWYNGTTGISYFEEPFMEALTPYTHAWYVARNLMDYDDNTSVLEAYAYAYEHDMARKAVRNPSGFPEDDPWKDTYPYSYRMIDESPWFDDGGNFLPTFKNGTDVGVWDPADGSLAWYTWLAKERYSGCVEDVNDDYKVDLTDISLAAQNYGYFFPAYWNSQCSLVDLNEDNRIDLSDYLAIALKFGWTP